MPEIILNGPEGRIEGRYSPSEKPNAAAALILHPHPLHGGTMNNKVVYNIYHSFLRLDFSVLRINFRGVGRSEGVFDHGMGELTDAATALDWLQLQNPNATHFWIAGFSFGAWIAMQLLMRRPEVAGFVAVSPPVNKYDFSFLAPCPTPGLIVQGDQDSVVPEDAVLHFVEKLSKQRNSDIDYRVVPGADHFFRNTMDQLCTHIEEYVSIRTSDSYKPKKSKSGADKKRRPEPAE